MWVIDALTCAFALGWCQVQTFLYDFLSREDFGRFDSKKVGTCKFTVTIFVVSSDRFWLGFGFDSYLCLMVRQIWYFGKLWN
ncbi:hypothetical protein QQP08_010546 [Theobroma cacao]|nr:hypothetical protein QQP08_010546 [Theobroma cacao]